MVTQLLFSSSRFWRWLREYVGNEAAPDGEDAATPSWIVAALTAYGQQRPTHAATIAEVYERLEEPQPLCHNVRSVGGLFNWKTVRELSVKPCCVGWRVEAQMEAGIVVLRLSWFRGNR